MSAPCYRSNSTEYHVDVTYIPCNLTAVENNEHSLCCAVGDLCLTNGLCRNQGDDDTGKNYYWRVGCTDESFEDPVCPKFCENIGGEDPNGNHMIFNCLEEESWCCAPSDADFKPPSDVYTGCCTESAYSFSAADPTVYTTAAIASIARSLGGSTTAIVETSAITSIAGDSTGPSSSPASATTTSTSSASASPTSSDSGGTSSALKVGLGVGISLGVVLIAAVGGLVYLFRRRHAQRQSLPDNPIQSPPSYYGQKHTAGPPVELPGREAPVEMHAWEGNTTGVAK